VLGIGGLGWASAEPLIRSRPFGLIALLHRLGMKHHKPNAVSRKLDPAKQTASIEAYEDLLNHRATMRRCCSPTQCISDACDAARSAAGPRRTLPQAMARSSGRQRLGLVNREHPCRIA
jgi:hypothetical protein